MWQELGSLLILHRPQSRCIKIQLLQLSRRTHANSCRAVMRTCQNRRFAGVWPAKCQICRPTWAPRHKRREARLLPNLEHVHNTKWQNMKILVLRCNFTWSGSAVSESRGCAVRRSKKRFRVAIAFHNIFAEPAKNQHIMRQCSKQLCESAPRPLFSSGHMHVGAC